MAKTYDFDSFTKTSTQEKDLDQMINCLVEAARQEQEAMRKHFSHIISSAKSLVKDNGLSLSDFIVTKEAFDILRYPVECLDEDRFPVLLSKDGNDPTYLVFCDMDIDGPAVNARLSFMRKYENGKEEILAKDGTWNGMIPSMPKGLLEKWNDPDSIEHKLLCLILPNWKKDYFSEEDYNEIADPIRPLIEAADEALGDAAFQYYKGRYFLIPNTDFVRGIGITYEDGSFHVYQILNDRLETEAGCYRCEILRDIFQTDSRDDVVNLIESFYTDHISEHFGDAIILVASENTVFPIPEEAVFSPSFAHMIEENTGNALTSQERENLLAVMGSISKLTDNED